MSFRTRMTLWVAAAVAVAVALAALALVLRRPERAVRPGRAGPRASRRAQSRPGSLRRHASATTGPVFRAYYQVVGANGEAQPSGRAAGADPGAPADAARRRGPVARVLLERARRRGVARAC